jgi:hypothetical protein
MDFFDKVDVELSKETTRKIIIKLVEDGVYGQKYLLSYPDIEVDSYNIESFKIIQVLIKTSYKNIVYLFNIEGRFLTKFVLTN